MGVDGSDGLNLACEQCGQPVATRIDDCSYWQAVWLVSTPYSGSPPTVLPATPLTAPPAHPWGQAERSLRTAHAALTGPNGDTHQAQGEIAAFGDFLHTVGLRAPRPLRADLQAAASAFNCANRPMIRADHQAGHALHKAGQELLYGTNSAGDFVIAVLAATVHLALAAAHWYEQRDHQQQAAAAQQTHARLRRTYEAQAARPVRTDPSCPAHRNRHALRRRPAGDSPRPSRPNPGRPRVACLDRRLVPRGGWQPLASLRSHCSR